MASVLPLFKQSLVRANQLSSHGRTQDASSVYENLARFSNLPTKVAVKVHIELGRIAYRAGKQRESVRYFTVALAHEPKNALILYLRARSLAAMGSKKYQRGCDDARASLQSKPDSAKANSLLGWLLCKMGSEQTGLKHLHRSVELNPKKATYLNRLVKMLIQSQGWEVAKAALTRALFLNRGNKKFQDIWNQFLFGQAGADQETLGDNPEGKLVVLPFLRLAQEQAPKGNTRYDGPESLPTPHATKARIIRKNRRVK